MELTETQYERMAPLLPVQRGNVCVSNRQPSCTSPRIAAGGGEYRRGSGVSTPSYIRLNRWSKNGVLDWVFEYLKKQPLVWIKLEAVSLDNTIVQVHPDGTGARPLGLRLSASRAEDGPPRFIWLPRIRARR